MVKFKCITIQVMINEHIIIQALGVLSEAGMLQILKIRGATCNVGAKNLDGGAAVRVGYKSGGERTTPHPHFQHP